MENMWGVGRPAGSLLQEDWLTLSSSARSAASGLPLPVEERLECGPAVRGEVAAASTLCDLFGLAVLLAGADVSIVIGLGAAGDVVWELSTAAGLCLCLCLGESILVAAVWAVLRAGILRASIFLL